MATTLKLMPALYSSGPHQVVTFPEAASQSFKAGQMVYLSSGKVTVCASNGTSVAGMAMGDASGTTDADCDVLLANEDTTFEMTISGASDPTFAATDYARKLAMLVANSRTYADVDDADNDVFVICGLKVNADGTNIIGDDYVRGYVKVLPAAYQFADGATDA